jgi:tetratricopeptide (TPR) repeat protein
MGTRLLHFISALLLCIPFALPVRAGQPQWVRLNSTHFALVTNAEEKQGHEAIARFEQMRAAFAELLMRTRINMSTPIEILALRSEEDYSAVVPGKQGPLLSDAFFIPGEDKYIFVLNLSRPDNWRAVSYDFAKVLLNYNYPPTQPWFDEGFLQYFSSLRLGGPTQIGGDPESVASRTNNFAQSLSSQPWLPATELFAMKAPAAGPTPSTKDAMFAAQSWMTMHYLINKEKLEATGTYLDLVLNQKLPIDQAIQQAFGMSAAQFDQAVKAYSEVILPQVSTGIAAPAAKGAAAKSIGQAPTVAADEEIGASRQDLPDEVGPALVAEVQLRVPEHHEAAINKLTSLASQPKLDNAIVHRALAFSYLQKNASEETALELSKAAELDAKDPWLHFYSALLKYHLAQASGQEFQGLANMMQDLRAVLDWYPEFAEAYNMLGLARVEGGGINSAMEAERAAIRLSPRNQQYQLNMAKIYIAAKQFGAAGANLRILAASSDPAIAQAAQKQLNDLPMLQKYGVPPQASTGSQSVTPPATASVPRPAAPPVKPSVPQPAREDESSEKTSGDEDQPPAQPQPDRRPVQYAKGRLVSVDCSQAPAAVLTVSSAGKSLHLRTPDYKALTLIGADEFSCTWKDRQVSANYKASGKSDGDLVSLELR